MKFLVVQTSGFLPHFLYAWSDSQPHWLVRRDIAKRFTRREARRIVDHLNAQRPDAINRVHLEPAREDE